MFEILGGWIARWWAAVILIWAILLGATELAAPEWDDVTHDGDLRYIPERYLSVQGQDLLQQAFPEDSTAKSNSSNLEASAAQRADGAASSRIVIVAHRRNAALIEADFAVVKAVFDQLVAMRQRAELPIRRLRYYDAADPPSQFEEADKRIGKRFTSPTGPPGQATLIHIVLATEFLEKRNVPIVDRIAEIVDAVRHDPATPTGLQFELAGEAALGRDILVAAEESDFRTRWTTVLLVTLILLIVYRTFVLALIPLVTIGVAVRASLNLVALMTQQDLVEFQLFNTTKIYIVVVLFGAGTDYCLFLLARFREELLSRKPAAVALRDTLARVGGAVTASAGTVICGLGMMYFAEFGKFRFSGVAIAISLFVALLAALTLAPAMLRLVGRLIGPRWLQTRRSLGFWENVSGKLAVRPGLIWLISVLVLLPLAVIGTHPKVTYDLLSELAADRPSRRGAAVIARHYHGGELGPVTVLLDARGNEIDFNTQQGRAALSQLENEIRALTWNSQHEQGRVVEVRSLVSPLGGPPSDSPGQLLDQFITQVLATDQYVSAQPGMAGRVTRVDVVFNSDPFSKVSLDGLGVVEHTVRRFTEDPASLLAGVRYSLAGTTAGTRDLKLVTVGDQWRIDSYVIAGIFAILLVLLRRPGICLYLVATVLFGYLVTLGTTEVVFQILAAVSGEQFQGLDWKVPLFLFTILVAVGADYNIFLMSRVKEEQAAHGPIEGIRRALAQTGGIISSCGVIMAGTFLSLMTGSLMALLQLGFALSFGVLLDTFVVRPVLVPAFMLVWERRRQRNAPGDSA